MRAVTTGTSYAHLVDPNRTWYNNKRIIILNFWILLLLLTSLTTAYSSTATISIISLPQWIRYFDRPAAGRLNILVSMQAFGSLAALPICPYVSDGFGRRISIFIGALIMCAAVAVQTAATSLDVFIAARFFVGFGLTFSVTAAPMLVAEIAYPAHRAPLTSAYGSLWYTGPIAATWFTFGVAKIHPTWSWRLISILQLIPSVFQATLISFGPESPRWLVSKNRNREALNTLAYYHADSNRDDPLVRFEYERIKAAINQEVATKIGWKTIFTTMAYHKRVNVLLLLGFASPWNTFPLVKALVSVGIADPNIGLFLTGVLQIWNFFWSLLAASLVDKVGCRTLFLTSFSGMVVFFSLQSIFASIYTTTGHQVAAYIAVAFIFLFYSFYSLAFPTLLVSYAVEIFPYSLRAKAMSLFSLALAAASFFVQYVHLPFTIGAMPWKYALIYVLVVLGVQAAAFWHLAKETKNRTLEESGTVFDGNVATENPVIEAENSTHSTEDEKPSQIFYEIRD